MLARTCRWFVAAAIAVTSVVPLPASASADDFTDIWWAGQAQSGWGVNMIQSQDVIFATLFVHGPAPSTTEFWYVASLDRTLGGDYTGDLYQTTGTGIGAAWNPADRTATKVGTATFSPTSTTTGTLVYNVGGVVVNKSIVRQTLSPVALGGAYTGTTVAYDYSCANPASAGTFKAHGDVNVTQTATRLNLVANVATDVCTFDGIYTQEGALFRIPNATYVCTRAGATVLNTVASVYAIKSTAVGLEFQWYAANAFGCQEDGVAAAVFP
jgi:hypothetical protein